MSTPATVLRQLNTLLEQINASTGGSDTTLTDAVNTLADAHANLKSSLGDLIDRSITTLSNDQASKVADYALYGCTTLTNASFPKATSVGTYGFNRCTTMTDVYLPLVTSIGSYAFRQCYMLSTIDLPSVTSISSYAFESNVRLTALILRSQTVCTLSATNAFNSCYHILGTVSASFNPDGLKDGFIYVPRALVEEYEAAANWSSFAGQFRAIEDYPEVCGV